MIQMPEVDKLNPHKENFTFASLMYQEGQIYRAVKNRKTIKFKKNNKNYFAKIYWGIGWWEIFKNILRGQKPVLDAKQEEQALLRLKKAEVSVPDVIACESHGKNPASRQSYIVLEAIEPSVSLEDYIVDWKNKPLAERRKILTEVATMARKMHEAGVNHRDFYICHFLLSPQNIKLTLIDLHRAQCRNKVPYRWQVKDLSALYFSTLSASISKYDYLRFIKIYTQQSLRKNIKNRLWHDVQKKAYYLYKKIHSVAPAINVHSQSLSRNSLPTLPATLHFSKISNTLMLKKILRWLPGRRAVFLADWKGKPVVVKLFLHSWKAKWHKQAEMNGLHKLEQNDFLSPELLYEGVSEQGFPLIITAYIDDAKSLSAWLKEDDKNIYKIVKLLAQHHHKGLWQQDLHLNNFLLKDDKIYSLDAAEIHSCNHPLAVKKSLQQLALFCAQIPGLLNKQAEGLLRYYLEQRHWTYDVFLNKKFMRMYHKIKYWRQKKFLPKLFRNCTAYKVQQNYYKRIIVRRDIVSPEFNLFLSDPDSCFTRHDVKILKNGHTCRVAKINIAGQHVVIKHYRRKSFWHGFKRLWLSTRAARCWYYAHLLEMHGIATPKPLAIIEKRWGWLRRDAYFISAYYSAPSLWNYMITKSLDDKAWDELRANWQLLEQRLVDAGLEHGDNKAQNFLVSDHKLVLLDLDSMKQHRCQWMLKRGRLRDQKRFLRSWNDYPEIKEKWNKK